MFDGNRIGMGITNLTTTLLNLRANGGTLGARTTARGQNTILVVTRQHVSSKPFLVRYTLRGHGMRQ